ncbi:MAG TPA: hypothetical protein DFH98_02820, partial [Psychrobacter sp.]|nr:hypothetical protein [Psychrobacter sp.]
MKHNNKMRLPMLAAVSMALFGTASMVNAKTEFTSQDWQVVCD